MIGYLTSLCQLQQVLCVEWYERVGFSELEIIFEDAVLTYFNVLLLYSPIEGLKESWYYCCDYVRTAARNFI
jgi:hypothetical protein